MQYRRFLLAVLFTLATSIPPVFAQRSARVAPHSLDELVQRSAVIVRGHVMSTTVERHPQFSNLNTIVVTIRVEEALKGNPGRTYSFRQFIWDPRDIRDAAGYRKGEELLMLMNASNEHGLTSPVGLGQGRFHIVRDAHGQVGAQNELGNAGLFRSMEARQDQQRGLSAEARRVVRAGSARGD